MPTYKNIHPDKQSIASLQNTDGEYVRLPYNKTIQTYRIYDQPDKLLLIDFSPYWSPITDTTTVSLTDSNDFQVVELDPNTFTVEILNMSEAILYLYYQSLENTKYLPIPAGASREIKHFKKYATQLIFKSSATVPDNEVFVTQFKE